MARLYDFQDGLSGFAFLAERAAVLADCGLGKSAIALDWADRVVRRTGRPVLILAPLAVGPQFIREAEKFGHDAQQARHGMYKKKIVISNYEMIRTFRPGEFGGIVCDEAALLRSAAGRMRAKVAEFASEIPNRLICTATVAWDDRDELDMMAEILGYPSYLEACEADEQYWRWLRAWAVACRKPSDVHPAFDDGPFVLPPLDLREHVVGAPVRDGFLFDLPPTSGGDRRSRRRETVRERCEKVAELASSHPRPVVVWARLNSEGDACMEMIPGAVQVHGGLDPDAKEARFAQFLSGEARVLVCKPTIAAHGLNFQHCSDQIVLAPQSFDYMRQCICRSYRYGQVRPVVVDCVIGDADPGFVGHYRAHAALAEAAFSRFVEAMRGPGHVAS